MQFSATYLHCVGESINNSGKELLYWKTLQIDFEKCHLGKRLLSDICSLASGATQVFFGETRAATAIAAPRAAVAWYMIALYFQKILSKKKKINRIFFLPIIKNVSLPYPSAPGLLYYKCIVL